MTPGEAAYQIRLLERKRIAEQIRMLGDQYLHGEKAVDGYVASILFGMSEFIQADRTRVEPEDLEPPKEEGGLTEEEKNHFESLKKLH